MKTIGAELRALREERSLSLADAALRAEISEGHLIALESDLAEGGPRVSDLHGLARAYEVDLLDLMILAGHITAADVERHVEHHAA